MQPTTIQEFERVYRQNYDAELQSCDRWIEWCERQSPPDTHGRNFYQGMRGALIFNDLKMCQLIRILAQPEQLRQGGGK